MSVFDAYTMNNFDQLTQHLMKINHINKFTSAIHKLNFTSLTN